MFIINKNGFKITDLNFSLKNKYDHTCNYLWSIFSNQLFGNRDYVTFG